VHTDVLAGYLRTWSIHLLEWGLVVGNLLPGRCLSRHERWTSSEVLLLVRKPSGDRGHQAVYLNGARHLAR